MEELQPDAVPEQQEQASVESQDAQSPAAEEGASDAPAGIVEVVVSDAQFQVLTDGLRATVTVGFFGCVLLALLLGSVLYGHFVKGWRS